MSRLRRVRGSNDEGSALALALTFLMVFGVLIGIVLSFASTGQRSTLVVREEATDTYAGGGALDGAINSLRGTLTQGTSTAGTTTCFTMPAGQLQNSAAVQVTCAPRSGSGAGISAGTASQPAQAVLTRSTDAAEGVVVEPAAQVTAQGDVVANRLVAVAPTATLTGTGAVTAGATCVGTSAPECTVAPAPADPLWPGPSLAATPLMGALPACAPLVTLTPGIYRSASAVQAVLDCPGAVIWLQTGTYFFDFRDAGSHELVVGAGAVVVGGTPAGWTPGAAGAAGTPPYPTAAAPTVSACDTASPGVDLVFAGDSRLAVQGGRTQLCALQTGGADQHVVLRSSTGVDVPSSGTSGTAASSDLLVPGARRWQNAEGGAAAGGLAAYVRLPNSGDPPSRLLVGPVSGALVPADATGITVTTTVRESVKGTGETGLVLRPGDGSAALPAALLRNCPASPCAGSATGPWRLDTVTTTGLTAAQVNAMSFEVVVTNPDTTPVEVWVDGVTVAVTYTVSVPAASGPVTASPYVNGEPATAALLSASGGFPATVLALHGTVYAPAAAIDIGLAGVPYTVIDRGLVARHLQLSATVADPSGPPLISIPIIGYAPRNVILTASTGARAYVRFANAAGDRNGDIPTVREWLVN